MGRAHNRTAVVATTPSRLRSREEPFRRMVADGGHLVEEWLSGAHPFDEAVIIYGDCIRCLTELQLRMTAAGAKPSPAAAAPCPATDEDDYGNSIAYEVEIDEGAPNDDEDGDW